MKPSCRTLIGLSLVLTAGCSSAPADDEREDSAQTKSMALSLVESNSKLAMDGCPADPSYRPSYPNPERVSQMNVTIGSNGKIVSSCRSGSQTVACNGTPFFTRVTPSELGTVVSVWDVFGRTVAERSFAARSEGTASANSQPDRRVTAEEVGGASPSTETGLGGAAGAPPASGEGTRSEGRGGAGNAAGAAPATTTGAGECSEDSIRTKACNDVNARLKAAGLSDQLDCTVAGTYAERDGELPDFADWDNKVRCDDIIEVLEDSFQACGDRGEMAYDNALHMIRYELLSRGVCRTSPLVLDLDGDGIHLSSLQDGTSFDLLGTGEMVRCSWVDGRDAFLAMDRNANGVIDGAHELFGNATSKQSFQDGFAALAQIDSNHDGQIDQSDPEMSGLVLWIDTNRDGRSGSDELVPLSEAGITSLNARPQVRSVADSVDEAGNSIPLVSSFTRVDGSHGALVDAFLRFSPISR